MPCLMSVFGCFWVSTVIITSMNKPSMSVIKRSFYEQDVLTVAPGLLGKLLVRKFENGSCEKYVITEVEAYRGEDDLACHASRGKTKRTAVMYDRGGLIYVYLIYGMYWMFNIVTGKKNTPQAVLIRGLRGIDGPGKVGRVLGVDKSFYGEDLTKSKRIWIEHGYADTPLYRQEKRVGVNYAKEWASKPWRYILK